MAPPWITTSPSALALSPHIPMPNTLDLHPTRHPTLPTNRTLFHCLSCDTQTIIFHRFSDGVKPTQSACAGSNCDHIHHLLNCNCPYYHLRPQIICWACGTEYSLPQVFEECCRCGMKVDSSWVVEMDFFQLIKGDLDKEKWNGWPLDGDQEWKKRKTWRRFAEL